jgi:glutamyl-tRNA(Gln) amidotransferase subunit E
LASERDINQPNLKPPSDVNPRAEAVLDFPDREFGELSEADYRELGFLSGLEVHQQLDTKKKLFCRCPSGVFVDHFDAEVLRHMRPTLSELGEYDGCALMEFKTRKEIVYQLERGTVCTYEIDDTPPFPINLEAIEIALEVSRLFDLKLVSELHVMRKQYLDGSIPTGFQRTAMVGLGGTIPFVEPQLGIDRPLRIRQLSLEEDSCREISDIGHRITFRTDRLGVPLTEVVTEPELYSPLELQAGARLLARTTRACGRVRRGAGAARQDVNVSVAGGRRVEIKGVHHHRGLPQLVHIEAYRQLNLLRVRAELLRRGVTREMFELPEGSKEVYESPKVLDATGILSSSDFTPLRDCLERGEEAVAVRLQGFGGLLKRRTQPGLTLANEFADRVRVIACLTSRPFLIHSDIEGYGFEHAHWKQLRTSLRAESGDAILVLWGKKRDLQTAVREVFLRAQDCLVGVPAETRQAFLGGTNGFERILPGADRMYPDTDTPPVPLGDGLIERVSALSTERPWEREARFAKLGLPFALCRRLSDAPWCELFDALKPPQGPVAVCVAYALEKRLPYFRRSEGVSELPSAQRLQPWVEALASARMRQEAAEAALDRLLREPEREAEVILRSFEADGGAEERLNELLRELEAKAATLHEDDPQARLRWAMGEIMPQCLGKLDPKRVRERLHSLLNPGDSR